MSLGIDNYVSNTCCPSKKWSLRVIGISRNRAQSKGHRTRKETNYGNSQPKEVFQVLTNSKKKLTAEYKNELFLKKSMYGDSMTLQLVTQHA